MRNFKIRIILVFFVIAFAVINVYAAGTAEITVFTPYANCNNTGTIFAYDLEFINFTGNFSMKFYIDGVLSYTLSDGPFYGPSYFAVSNSISGIIVGSPRPDHSIYQIVLQANGVTVFDYRWDCTTGLQVLTPSPSPTNPDETSIQPIPAFNDGRLNRYDAAAPIAVYPHEDGLAIYAIDANSEGYLVFTISREEIEVVGVPSENTILLSSEDGQIALWRLANGQFMLQAPTLSGKIYYLFFDSLEVFIGYSSYES